MLMQFLDIQAPIAATAAIAPAHFNICFRKPLAEIRCPSVAGERQFSEQCPATITVWLQLFRFFIRRW